MQWSPEAERGLLEQQVASFPYWFHRIELPGGVVTPGVAPLDPKFYRLPEDMSGQRVLDVGAWDGYWTFEALKRGAREVVAIDDFSDRLARNKASERRAWDTFDFCRAALGYDAQRCQRHELSVYDVSEERLGRFDAVFLFAVLYDLRHPLLALDRLAAVCDGAIYVETGVADFYSPYRGGYGKGFPDGDMVMEFYPGREYGNNTANWWVPTLRCLTGMLHAAGFGDIQAWRMTAQAPDKLFLCRGFASARRRPGLR